MGAIAYALSVSHFVNSVGAKAGFAAIIAVALLVLLFFAQMRETASLRDRAAASDEHVQQLEQRVAQLSRGFAATSAGAPAVVPAPAGVSRAPVVPAPAGVAVAAAAGAVASRAVRPSIPSAPAGVGAPALSSATRLIPSGDESPISIRATGAGAAPPVAAGVAAASAGGSFGSGGAVAAPPGPRPATAAGGANGGPTASPPPIPAPAPPPASARPTEPPRPPARNGAARQPLTTSRPTGSSSSSRIRAALMIAAGVAVVAVVVIVLLNATSGGTSTSSSSAASTSSHRSHHGARATVPLKPSNVLVTVLNGTLTTNLAHDITQRLAGSGYRTGTPATATDHTVSSTVVGYRGRTNRAAALLVARSLKLGPASVQPVGQSNLAVACPQTSTCTAQVIVTVGADLTSAAGTA